MSYLAIAKRVVRKIEERERKGVTILAQRITARVRGKEDFEHTYDPDVCWHCQGSHSCNCASCGLSSLADWEPGRCGACRGTGYLTWGVVN